MYTYYYYKWRDPNTEENRYLSTITTDENCVTT